MASLAWQYLFETVYGFVIFRQGFQHPRGGYTGTTGIGKSSLRRLKRAHGAGEL